MTGKAFRTHYDNLKVARNAPLEVIRAAYKTLSQKYHPDRNPGDPNAARILAILNAAYAALSDPEKRRQHDEWIAAQEAGGQPVTPIAAANPSPPKAPASDSSPYRSSPPPLPAICLTRINIILLTIAAAIAAFLFPPYTITNYKGVVLESGFYFVLGETPSYPKIIDPYENRSGARIHATINTTMLLIELFIISAAGAALAFTTSGGPTTRPETRSEPIPEVIGGHLATQNANHGSSEKTRNGRSWAMFALIIVGVAGGAKVLTMAAMGSNAVILEATKVIIATIVLVPIAYVLGWIFGKHHPLENDVRREQNHRR